MFRINCKVLFELGRIKEFSVLVLCGKRKQEDIEEVVEEEEEEGGVPVPSKGGRDRRLPQAPLASRVKAMEGPRS